MTISKKAVLSVSLFILLLWGVVLSTYATPPLSPYTVTDNATDPTCAPGTANCYVTGVTADNGLTATGSNVRLGGALVQNTAIDQDGNEFILQGTNAKLVSGADPLDLFPLIGEAFPGVGISTDGILTGGVKSYIGSLISPSNNKPLTIVGNFDLANGIQAAMVAEDKEVNIYSSDGVSGSSNISLNSGDLSLSASNGINIYSNNYINFNNFGSGRDDSGTNFPTNFLYTDGSGNLQSAPLSLLGGGGAFSLTSQDEGTSLTSATNTYNFTGAGVTATNSGGVVTVNIPGGGGDGSIYLNDGTLTAGRIVDLGTHTLNFQNGEFSVGANSSVSIPLSLNGTSTASNNEGVFIGGTNNALTASAVSIFGNNSSTGSDIQIFPFNQKFKILNLVTDNTADQVLAKDGLGNSVWRDVSSLSGGGGTNIYNSNGTLTGNRTLDANGNNLTFSNLDQLLLATQSGNVGIIMSDKGSGYGTILSQGQELISGNDHRSQIATDIGDGNYDADFDDLHLGLADTAISGINTGAAIEVSATTGIRFRFRNGGVMSNYFFPRTDGTASQILSTDGFGQLGWTTVATSPITIQNGTSLFSTGLSGTGSGSIATDSNFFGSNAGRNATNSYKSNFFGLNAGRDAINAMQSNFFGESAGQNAQNAGGSIFMGEGTGQSATNASGSIFLGPISGTSAVNASNSIFLGWGAGAGDIVNNTGNTNDFSILIGKSTSTGGFSNSIALGSHATNTSSNQFMIGSTTRPIDQTKIIGSLGTECTITTGTGMACTSDQTLKTNILDLPNSTLDNLLKVRTVTYNWLQNPNSSKQIGFLAQDLEQYFPELVTTDSTGKKAVYYSQITPILVEAIREMNLNITELSNTERPNTWRDTLIAWFESTTNGIRSLVVHDKICVDDQCLTKDDIKVLLQMKNGNTGSVPTSPPSDNTPSTPDPLVCTAPQVLNQAGDTCIDPEPTQSEETPPTETPSAEEPTPTE